MAKIKIDDAVVEDYKKTAIKWEPTLLDLPIRTASDITKYMFGLSGLRGKLNLGQISAKSHFAPFSKSRVKNSDVNIAYRTIETHLGNAIEEFAPVDYAYLTMGYNDPILGDKIKNASTTALILFHISKARGEGIAQALLTGKYNPDGDQTTDLCDGLVTIAEQEIEAGAISTEIGNLIKLQDAFTMQNTCDLIKEEVLFRLNYYLRQQDSVLLCAPDVVDMYNQSYQATHAGLVYNTTYNQPYVEGSNNKLTLVGVPEMAGQKHLILSQKSNMYWATDNKSDESFVDLMRKNHYELSFAANLFLGTQFRTIDPRRLCIIELPDDAPAKPAEQPAAPVQNDNNPENN